MLLMDHGGNMKGAIVGISLVLLGAMNRAVGATYLYDVVCKNSFWAEGKQADDVPTHQYNAMRQCSLFSRMDMSYFRSWTKPKNLTPLGFPSNGLRNDINDINRTF
jgi:hypothetical protein